MARVVYLLLSVSLLCSAAQSQHTPVQIQFDAKVSAKQIPDDFLGLSFETLTLLPHTDAPLYFTPDNRPLIQLFHTLGIRSLRIGGNTADTPSILIPTGSEIDQLFQFAQLAGAKVIYTLRLRESSIPKVAEAAKYLMDRHAAQIDCLAIGN